MVAQKNISLAAFLFLVSKGGAFLLTPRSTTTPSSSSSAGTPCKVVNSKPTQDHNSRHIATASDVPATSKDDHRLVGRHAQTHKRWGIDKGVEDNYWYDQRVHSIGNIGLGGGLHAAIAPMATKRIDDVAYGGVDLRLKVARELSLLVTVNKARVLDLCCGVGMSTRALHQAFPNASQIIGLDTSPHMVAMANFVTKHLQKVMPWLYALRDALKSSYAKARQQGRQWEEKASKITFKDITFAMGNAQDTKLPSNAFDLITIMYAFHEAPDAGRALILQEARRLLSPGGLVAIIDIATDYKPSPGMLAGEPYVLEYQQNIHHQLRNIQGFRFTNYETLVPGHVGMWILRATY